jgi:hypothetical protein
MTLVQRDYADHGIPASIAGETCSLCRQPKAAHKIGEELPATTPMHNLTNWLCCACFRVVFGTAHDTFPYNYLE